MVLRAVGALKVTEPGPDCWDHWNERVDPAGLPSSLAEAFTVRVAGNVMVATDGIDTIGGLLAGFTVIVTPLVVVNSESLTAS